MRSSLLCCLILMLLTASTALYGQQATLAGEQSVVSPLSNREVLEMLKIGLPPEVIVAKIKGAPCRFDTSVGTLKDLKAAAVPDSVLLAMVQAASPHDGGTAESTTWWRDFVPLLQTLPWPTVVLVALVFWRTLISRLLLAVVRRVESGAEVEAGGVVLHEPPNETYKPPQEELFI